jgi:hypothetical protein
MYFQNITEIVLNIQYVQGLCLSRLGTADYALSLVVLLIVIHCNNRSGWVQQLPVYVHLKAVMHLFKVIRDTFPL